MTTSSELLASTFRACLEDTAAEAQLHPVEISHASSRLLSLSDWDYIKQHGLYKFVLRAGTSSELRPLPHSPCKIHYMIRKRTSDADSWNIHKTTLHSFMDVLVGGVDEPAQIDLLSPVPSSDDFTSHIPDQLHHAVITMTAGEISRFAYHLDDSSLIVADIGLVEFGQPLPPAPSKQHIDAAERSLKQNDREQYAANPPPSLHERFVKAVTLKHEGNLRMSSNDARSAKQRYNTAFAAIFVSDADLEFSADFAPEQRASSQIRLACVRATLWMNRCAANVKLCLFDDAVFDADQAVQALQGLRRPQKGTPAPHTAEEELALLAGPVEELPVCTFLAKAMLRRCAAKCAHVAALLQSTSLTGLEELAAVVTAAIADVDAAEGLLGEGLTYIDRDLTVIQRQNAQQLQTQLAIARRGETERMTSFAKRAFRTRSVNTATSGVGAASIVPQTNVIQTAADDDDAPPPLE